MNFDALGTRLFQLIYRQKVTFRTSKNSPASSVESSRMLVTVHHASFYWCRKETTNAATPFCPSGVRRSKKQRMWRFYSDITSEHWHCQLGDRNGIRRFRPDKKLVPLIPKEQVEEKRDNPASPEKRWWRCRSSFNSETNISHRLPHLVNRANAATVVVARQADSGVASQSLALQRFSQLTYFICTTLFHDYWNFYTWPDYGIGIIGKRLRSTTSKRRTKNGCKIFWTC